MFNKQNHTWLFERSTNSITLFKCGSLIVAPILVSESNGLPTLIFFNSFKSLLVNSFKISSCTKTRVALVQTEPINKISEF